MQPVQHRLELGTSLCFCSLGPLFPAGCVVFDIGGIEVAVSALSALCAWRCQSMGATTKYAHAEHTALTKSALLDTSLSAHCGDGDMDLKRIRTIYVYRDIL